MKYKYTDIAKMIDHSLLNPTLTPAELENGCRLVAAFDVASVCIMPFAVKDASRLLAVRELGCSRVGATRTVSICNTARKVLNLEEITGFTDTPAGY